MSAMTDGGKSKFFGFLKGLFVKPEGNGTPDMEPLDGEPLAEPLPTTTTAPARPAPYSNGSNGHGAATSRRQPACVQLPLHAILPGLPLELRARVKQTDVGNLTVSVALEKVLAQLAQGAVKVPFGDIRRSAPDIFDADADRDSTPVLLPLNEILSQLNPALLVRRPAQKQVEVPTEIISPFEGKGQGVAFSVGNAKPVTPAAPRQAAPAPALPARGSISSVSTPLPPASTPIPMRHSAPPMAPSGQITPIKPMATNGQIMPIAPITPISPVAESPAPAISPLRLCPEATPPAAPAAPVEQPVSSASDSPTLSVALKKLAANWPEVLRQEIVQSNLVDAQLLLPCNVIENALKRGRAAFPWRTVRSWIHPAPMPSVSSHDTVELEFPLRVIAPMFLERQNADTKTQRKVAIDEAIPNLFFGFPRPDTLPQAGGAIPASGFGAGAVSKPVDTNYYVWSDVSETAQVDESEYKRKSSTGTDFIARYATPNEIVSRAAALDGVAGALIALPDGLMVANRIPAELNGDTLAAFLPQIFSKVSQCTKELRMGDLNNLNFTVGNVPWKIFRVNAIFFAAFGRVAEGLPTAQLAALAAELDRKK